MIPGPDQILSSLENIANDWSWVAVIWHVYLAALVVLLAVRIRPSRRIMGLALAVPLFSVSALAWSTANLFNAIVFAVSGIVLGALALRLQDRPVRAGPLWVVVAGAFLFAFGWVYPHFLRTESFLPYLYSAPTGLVPCPTLAVLIGLTLVLDGLESRWWSGILGAIGIFYGVFGAVRLGVTLDWVLLAGALVLFGWYGMMHRFGEHPQPRLPTPSRLSPR